MKYSTSRRYVATRVMHMYAKIKINTGRERKKKKRAVGERGGFGFMALFPLFSMSRCIYRSMLMTVGTLASRKERLRTGVASPVGTKKK